MIKVKVTPALVEDFLRNGCRGCEVIENALPPEASLVAASVVVDAGGPVLELRFDDGNPDMTRTLNPTLHVPHEDHLGDDRME